MVDSQDELVSNSELIVIGNKNKDYLSSLEKINKNQVVIDLVRISDKIEFNSNYNGICW